MSAAKARIEMPSVAAVSCLKITYISNREKRLARTEISITYKPRSFRVF